MMIWDLPTRLYHWLQAIIFIMLIISGFGKEDVHSYLGIFLFILLLWRVAWGCVGSETSRFAQFISTPKTVINYLLGKQAAPVGHNPLGGWMVMLMIITLFIQCITGLIVAGLLSKIPLLSMEFSESTNDLCALIHGITARLLILLTLIHITAILVYKFRDKPLVWTMITGKQKENYSTQPLIESNSRAILVLIIAALVTITIIALSI
ncbi:MAG: cytochrome b/b6 domain-containing protein [Colwellia sp.]|nr:cytochrome b/b6 domain-containing protein [Colwellia sp.]MCW8863715.1 cytochrome b/b6 domain-containing protein [Colwellia sp.]MCW9081354.1 cytochrome b/b6 domain-containing protein [Colwellia sp.]